MALIVEDGSGKSDADSYLSVADADTYHTNHSGSTDWSGAATAVKEKSLRLATQYLNIRFNGLWKGYKATDLQALAWPRVLADKEDVYDAAYYDSESLPIVLENATAELALRVVQGDTLYADISKPGTIKRKRVKTGPIETETEYAGGYNQVKKYPLIEGLIKPLISIGVLERG
jgi:hypothetical protein